MRYMNHCMSDTYRTMNINDAYASRVSWDRNVSSDMFASTNTFKDPTSQKCHERCRAYKYWYITKMPLIDRTYHKCMVECTYDKIRASNPDKKQL